MKNPSVSICAVEGCDRRVYGRGWCSMHYQRWRMHGDLRGAKTERERNEVCSIEKCDQKSYSRGWCPMHYHRYKRHGDPNVVLVERQIRDSICSVEGCGGPHYGQGLCSLHYQRWYKNGDVNTTRRTPNGSVEVTYIGAHQRAYRLRGAAAQHACVDCGDPAQEWSYTHDCPRERIEYRRSRSRKIPMAYCPCPDSAHFDPRCKSCHTKFDLAA